MRLQRYLAAAGVCSRRKAEDLIRGGKVSVNGKIIRDPAFETETGSKIYVLGEPLKHAPEKKRYFVFHKPRGVVTTLSDPEGRKSIAYFLRKAPVRLFPVGRLDFDVSGLILLTNDGALCEKMMHPRSGHRRTYIARVTGRMPGRKRTRLEDGVASAKKIKELPRSKRVEQLLGKCAEGQFYLEIEVSEGRKHLVKRLLRALGAPVFALTRTAYCGLELGDLRPGEMKEIARSRVAIDN